MKKLFVLIAVFAIAVSAEAQIEIINNGNVGIGIASPTQKLHVVGNSFLNGNLGVGIQTPAQKLHVVGSTYLTGKVGIGVNPGISSPTLHVSGSARIENFNTTKPGGLTIEYIPVIQFENGIPISFDLTELRGMCNNNLSLGNTDNKLRTVWTNYINGVLYNPSDMRLKENIRLCPSFLSKLKDVKSYNYNYTDEYFKDFTPEDKQKAQKTEFGFLAQELQKVFPELVREEENGGMLSINYVSMIPILTSAINELQQKIETLEKRLLELESKKGGE